MVTVAALNATTSAQRSTALEFDPATHTYRLLPLESTKRVARVLPEVVVWAPRGVVPG